VGVMMIGARLLGAGRLAAFKQLVNLHVAFAAICALASFASALVASDVSLSDQFTNHVDRASFDPVAESVWPAAIVLQPFRALVGVYGPILMACQGYVAWGVTVTACFFMLYLPITIVAAVVQDVRLLIWANVVYMIVHWLVLVYLVHVRMLPRILSVTAEAQIPPQKVAPAPARPGSEPPIPTTPSATAMTRIPGRTTV
jgi:hypothetical protein